MDRAIQGAGSSMQDIRNIAMNRRRHEADCRRALALPAGTPTGQGTIA